MTRKYKLSPSDFAFLWEQCKRCFYVKVVHGIRQPSMPMASIFKRIEGLQMDFYNNKNTREICKDLPAGVMRCGEKWVESEIIQIAGHDCGCYLVGKLDSVIEFDDMSWGILDFKTTEAKKEKAELYSKQLHAYANALEHPALNPASVKSRPLKLSPISKLGLLCFEPRELRQPTVGLHSYEGKVSWIEIERNDQEFLNFLGEILSVLEGQIPEPTPDCDWCKYANVMSDKSMIQSSSPASQDLSCPKCGSAMTTKQGRYGPFLSCTKYPSCKGTRNLTQ